MRLALLMSSMVLRMAGLPRVRSAQESARVVRQTGAAGPAFPLLAICSGRTKLLTSISQCNCTRLSTCSFKEQRIVSPASTYVIFFSSVYTGTRIGGPANQHVITLVCALGIVKLIHHEGELEKVFCVAVPPCQDLFLLWLVIGWLTGCIFYRRLLCQKCAGKSKSKQYAGKNLHVS